jgi:hypothetical protein
MQIVVGCDFNVDKMAWVIGIKRGDVLNIVDEVIGMNTNTYRQVEALTNRLRDIVHAVDPFRRVDDIIQSTIVYTDAAGKNRTTSANESDIQILRAAGFDGLVVDEAHMGIKNENAERNKVVTQWNPDMKLLMLMTGTPIVTGPSDIVEYVKTLSKGEVWNGMTTKRFTDEYLEASPIPSELGLIGAAPKLKVKSHKEAELAAIVASWIHVAMPKDVKGKTLPSVRIEENKHAHMKGTQALLYAYFMASASDEDKARLAAGGLDDEEVQKDKDSEQDKSRTAIAKKIVVFGDNDLSFTGQAKAYELAHRLTVKNGLDVDVEIPTAPGTDWNDVLLQRG